MCNLGRMFSLEFEDSVSVKAKVGLLHGWRNAVIYIATLIFAWRGSFVGASEERAEHFLAAAKSSWLFDGPWA